MHELEVFVLDERRVVTTPDELAEALAARSDGGTHLQIASTTAPIRCSTSWCVSHTR